MHFRYSHFKIIWGFIHTLCIEFCDEWKRKKISSHYLVHWFSDFCFSEALPSHIFSIIDSWVQTLFMVLFLSTIPFSLDPMVIYLCVLNCIAKNVGIGLYVWFSSSLSHFEFVLNRYFILKQTKNKAKRCTFFPLKIQI